MADKIKLALAFLIIAGAIVAYYQFADQAVAYRVGGIIVALAIAVAIAMQSAYGRNTWAFVQESQLEVRKVVWPTRAETVRTTGLVVAMVVMIAAILWVVDAILIWAVRMLTGQGA